MAAIDRTELYERAFLAMTVCGCSTGRKESVARQAVVAVLASLEPLLASAHRDGAADALDWLAARWVCATPDGSDTPYTRDERLEIRQYAVEIRADERPVPSQPEPEVPR